LSIFLKFFSGFFNETLIPFLVQKNWIEAYILRKNIFLFVFILFIPLLVACTEEEQTFDDKPIQTEEKHTNVDDQQPADKKQPTKKTTHSLKPLTVHYLDVGQADATLFQYTDGKDQYTILYDVGDWRGNEVVPFLEKAGIEWIDLIIISHPHADHIGQLDKVLNRFAVGEVWMSGNTATTNVYQTATEAILNKDVDYDEPRAGDVFDIGPMELHVLHPASLTGGLNEDSLSIHFTYGDVSFLFTGDAYKQQEKLMIERSDALQADFLQLGHHGSNSSSDPAFIKAVNPTYAIYSAGKGNSYGHPHKEVVNLINDQEITLYGTDVHGTITVSTDGINYDVMTEKEGEVAVEKKPSDQKNNDANSNAEQKNSNKTSDGCININEASKSELTGIIHIGKKRAEELIRFRPYQTVEELTKINGIGPARIADILAENKACVGDD